MRATTWAINVTRSLDESRADAASETPVAPTPEMATEWDLVRRAQNGDGMAITALEGPDDCIEEHNRIYQHRRDLLVDALRACGLRVQPPKAELANELPILVTLLGIVTAPVVPPGAATIVCCNLS